MIEVVWDFSDVNRFKNNLAAGEIFEKQMERTAKELAKKLKQMIKQFTPVKTGKLKRGWNGNYKITKQKDGFLVEFTNNVEYARWVNYGHRSFNQYNKGGSPYIVKHRTVMLNSRWGQTASPYYVYGWFFLETGVLLTEEQQANRIIANGLRRFWRECINT